MNWKRVLKSWYFWSAMIFIVILSVIWETWNSVTVDMVGLPKFETGGISKVLTDQNGVMIAGAIIVGIIVLYLFAPILIVGIILTLAFIGYREWDSVEKGVWNTKGFADKAITREVTLSAITGVELEPFEKSLPTRYFRVRIRADKDTYWGTCDDGDVFQGISVINTRIKERFSSEANLSDGNIVIQGENGSPTRDGGLVEIKNKPPRVFLDTEKKKSGCKTDAPLKVSIQFIPENP